MAKTLNPYYLGRVPNEAQLAFATVCPELKERIFLGCPGTGKTTSVLQEMVQACLENPGALWLASRWTEGETQGILKTDLLREVPPEVIDHWDGSASTLVLRNGSKILCQGLKAADDAGRYSKWAGLSLSGIVLSQTESIPLDVTEKLLERLRAPIGPRVMLMEGNLDVALDHWLRAVMASAVPVGPYTYRSGPRLVVVAPFAVNERNLPEDRVRAHRARYPEGSPGYGPAVGGFFETPIDGVPVYGSLFRPEVHLAEVEADPTVPLLEAWDFGIARPAVLWAQWWPFGRLRILGELMGDGTPLGEMVLERTRLLNTWFGRCKAVWTTVDPSGQNRKDTGLSSLAFLQRHGIPASAMPRANTPAVRGYAIEQVRELMGRRVTQGECFGIHPRCKVLIEAVKIGYVRDKNRADGMPLKSGYYDHLANCLEYIVTAFWQTGEPTTDNVGELIRLHRDKGEPPDSPWDVPGARPSWNDDRRTGY